MLLSTNLELAHPTFIAKQLGQVFIYIFLALLLSLTSLISFGIFSPRCRNLFSKAFAFRAGILQECSSKRPLLTHRPNRTGHLRIGEEGDLPQRAVPLGDCSAKVSQVYNESCSRPLTSQRSDSLCPSLKPYLEIRL